VVGGYAVSLHAQPRATKDLDLLVSPDAANSEAVYAALIKFGAQELDEIQQTQARSRAAWLELRRQESESPVQDQDGSTNDPGKELDNDLEL
jgi:hypothetical protein